MIASENGRIFGDVGMRPQKNAQKFSLPLWGYLLLLESARTRPVDP